MVESLFVHPMSHSVLGIHSLLLLLGIILELQSIHVAQMCFYFWYFSFKVN